MKKIVTDIFSLRRKCQPVKDYDEAEKIAKELFHFLIHSQDGIGLAANQIGINKAVCVVNVWRPLWFMNPTMKSVKDEKIEFQEACLSFPNQSATTERFQHISVIADNHENPLYFGPWHMLECICVQHEICHLNGETMFDYKL